MQHKLITLFRLALLICFLFLHTTSQAMAEDIELGEQCETIGNQVTFTLSIASAPNNFDSMGVDIIYDPGVLEFTISDFSGTLLESFSYKDAYLVNSGLIRIGAFTTGEAISSGDSGNLVALTFTVSEDSATDLLMQNLKDGIKEWTSGRGHFCAQYTQANVYELTINTEGQGIISLDPAGGTYTSGTAVTITATPDEGSMFNDFTGNVESEDNPSVVLMDADKTVTANFSASSCFIQTAASRTNSKKNSVITKLLNLF